MSLAIKQDDVPLTTTGDAVVVVTGTRVSLDVRGAPAWSPDERWLAVAASRDREPRLFKVPVGGGAAIPLVSEYSLDPTWAPSGAFLVYSGPDVGTNFSVKAVNADGTPHPLPDLILMRGARRLVFLHGDGELVVSRATSRTRTSGPSTSRPDAAAS